MPSAGLLVIGDEILSGKTADTNTPFLIGELHELGVSLREIAVVPDCLDAIAEAIRRLSGGLDHVFTSGGVGPTHDDVTVEGVARAFECPITRHPVLEKMLREYYAARGLPGVERGLRMADVPAGASLICESGLQWPVLQVRNVYVLPGVPEIFRRKFLAIRERFRSAPFHLRQIFIKEEETAVAHYLDRVVAGHPTVAVGSYPRFSPAPDGHKVKITLEGGVAAEVERASAELRELLGPAVVRSE